MTSSAYHNQDTNAMDILSIIFFLVAGAWLIAALLYSLLVLCFLRMRSNGTLGNLHDENFGRVNCCGLFSIPMGCIFRRYARHLQMEDIEQVPHSHVRRFMTKDERRAAVQHLLSAKKATAPPREEMDVTSTTALEDSDLESSGGVEVCSICLCGYDEDDEIIQACDKHLFHKDCILDWLQMPNRTDCPCCRTTIVMEESIYKTVKKLRKQRKRDKQEREQDISETEQMGEDEL